MQIANKLIPVLHNTSDPRKDVLKELIIRCVGWYSIQPNFVELTFSIWQVRNIVEWWPSLFSLYESKGHPTSSCPPLWIDYGAINSVVISDTALPACSVAPLCGIDKWSRYVIIDLCGAIFKEYLPLSQRVMLGLSMWNMPSIPSCSASVLQSSMNGCSTRLGQVELQLWNGIYSYIHSGTFFISIQLQIELTARVKRSARHLQRINSTGLIWWVNSNYTHIVVVIVLVTISILSNTCPVLFHERFEPFWPVFQSSWL